MSLSGTNGLSIFLYHRILPEARFNPLQTIVTVKEFEKQLDSIASRHDIISMSEALTRINDKTPFKNHAALTFDDGYSDNYEIAFPILKKKGIPALFSIVTNYIGSKRPLWDWEILSLLNRSSRDTQGRGPQCRGISIGKKKLKRRFFEHQLAFGYRIIERLKAASLLDIEHVIQQLGGGIPRADRCMNWDEIITLRRHGMEIASHTLSHRSLARIPSDEAMEEISESKNIIEKNMGTECHYFCFPFGSERDISDVLRKKTQSAGYLGSLLNIHGTNDMTTDPFGFKRIIMT